MDTIGSITDYVSAPTMQPIVVGAPLSDLAQRDQFGLFLDQAISDEVAGEPVSDAGESDADHRTPTPRLYERITFFQGGRGTSGPCLYWCSL